MFSSTLEHMYAYVYKKQIIDMSIIGINKFMNAVVHITEKVLICVCIYLDCCGK